MLCIFLRLARRTHDASCCRWQLLSERSPADLRLWLSNMTELSQCRFKPPGTARHPDCFMSALNGMLGMFLRLARRTHEASCC